MGGALEPTYLSTVLSVFASARAPTPVSSAHTGPSWGNLNLGHFSEQFISCCLVCHQVFYLTCAVQVRVGVGRRGWTVGEPGPWVAARQQVPCPL